MGIDSSRQFVGKTYPSETRDNQCYSQVWGKFQSRDTLLHLQYCSFFEADFVKSVSVGYGVTRRLYR
jgi:hypothetical protein